MNQNFPVYTTPNECQDCYKCVRHCHCKAIRIVNARAAVIPELCVSCGQCVRVCPAHAKKIRSDLSRMKYLISAGERVYASVAPSHQGYFKGVGIGKIAAALKKLGFAGCGETALGAQFVSARTGAFLQKAEDGVWLSSACPAAVDYVRKYLPEWTKRIVPVLSPVMAHCRMMKKEFGDDIKTVFIGPCAAKKNESDRNPDELTLALTFQTLESWLEEAEIDPAVLEDVPVVPYPAEEGRLYSLEGGMNDTLRDPALSDTTLIAVSGLANIGRVLEKTDSESLRKSGRKLFIEMLACDGGCVNGPSMENDSSGADVLIRTALSAKSACSLSRDVTVDISMPVEPENIEKKEPSPAELQGALEKVGKYSSADELNCGGCGYNSCREFAAAMLVGKAEPSMCLSYLRRISQKTSNALIRYIPAAVVLADRKLQVLECNRHFAAFCGEDTLSAYDSCGNLTGAYLSTMIEFTDLFDSVLDNGGEIEKFNQVFGDRILNISVFSITPGQTAGAVIQDVTQSELRREQVAERAREVIRKNVMTVQKIARDLGEHMAETEILLKEVAGTYEHKETLGK